jgi:hypothetical protein
LVTEFPVNPFVVIIPVLVVAAVAFVTYCLIDLARAAEVRYLPKWGWAILCMGLGLTIPWGGILYLAIGKVRPPKPPREGQVRALWPRCTTQDGAAS